MKIAAVSYWYPHGGASDPNWTRLLAIKPAIVIVNPHSGPGSVRDPNYRALCERIIGTGIRCLGYISTRWAKPTGAEPVGGKQIWEVTQERLLYQQLYKGIQGYFYDETPVEKERLDYYIFLYQPMFPHIEAMVLNPGAYPDPVYLRLPAVKMVVETDRLTYLRRETPLWAMREQNRNHFWHCVYDVKTAAQMREVVETAHMRNAGYVWACEDKSYSAPPPYLEEMAALAKTL